MRAAAAAWAALEDRTAHALRSAAAAIEAGAPCAAVVDSALSPLADAWRGVHAQVSRAGRGVERRLGAPLLPLCPGEGDERALAEAAVAHLYREGRLEAGDALAEELAGGADAMRPGKEGASGLAALRGVCVEMHGLREALVLRRDIGPADAWARDNAAALGADGERLRFQLHCLAYIGMLRPPHLAAGDGSAMEVDSEDDAAPGHADTKNKARSSIAQAVEYAAAHLAPFHASYAADVQALLGAAAFCGRPGGLERSPYAALLLEDLWGEAEDMLVGAFCRVAGLPAESPLRLAHTTGLAAWPRISRVLSLVRDKQSGASLPDELPVEVELPAHHRFHSVFVCPVLRQPATPENPPMVMACGHVICAEALGRLSKGNAAYRFKCPYCPQESTAAQALRLHL